MSPQDARRRVVITGLGLVTPLGQGVETVWGALLAGKSGVRRITQFRADELPCRIAGEIPDFDPESFISAKEARRMSRASQVALAAAIMAVADSRLRVPFPDPEGVGVVFGTAIGGLEKAAEAIRLVQEGAGDRISPFAVPATLPNMPAFHISLHFGALGPNATITTACASGTQAVGDAAEVIRGRRAEVVLAGGADALIRDFAIAGFCAMRALPTSFNDAPQQASRPFDARREGFVFSEGAACLVLESLEHAAARGAHVYAEVAGHASSSDSFHLAAPDPSAAGAVRTMAWALRDAGIDVASVEYINAHGTSTPSNDAVETLAIKRLFGERARAVPVSSTKSMIGHAMGAAGAIEAAVCALTIERGTIHPTANYDVFDPACDLDYVPNQARRAEVKVALSNSFGLGGQNACLVLRRAEENPGIAGSGK